MAETWIDKAAERAIALIIEDDEYRDTYCAPNICPKTLYEARSQMFAYIIREEYEKATIAAMDPRALIDALEPAIVREERKNTKKVESNG